MNSKRTDRAIIIVALLVLLLALGAFYGFDSFFGNRNRAVAEQYAIAEIIDVKGDYRMRFYDELHWQRARKGQKLVYDDAIFSGDKSEVDLKVMDSRLKLSEKTLIVLRKDQIFTYLKMDYGVLRGMLAKGDRFMVESNGEKFELTGVDDANLIVDNRNGKLTVRVDSGNARVVRNGKVQNLSSRDVMVIGGTSDPLRFEAPARGRMYTRQSEDSVQFRWAYTSGQVAPTSETFTLEAGTDVSLSRLILKETVSGRQEFTAPRVRVPQDLYYRVKDSRGNFSEIHKLVLAQPAVPQLMLPTDRSVIPTAVGQTAPVDIEFAPMQPDARLVTQISRDPDFQQLVAERSGTSPQLSESLPAGPYFMRAKSVFGRVESDWSKSSTFIVQEALDPQRLAMARVPTKIVIPNREYPKSLYQAPRAQVQQFVKDLAPFPAFFADLMFKQQNLMVMRRAGKEQPRSITSPEFPAEWIRPGVVDLAYHFESEGVPATRSVLHRVLIRMEAPNRLRATDKGQMSWSPILFAEAYEVEVKDDQNRTQSLISPKPSARADVVGGRAYAYRVRALGADGQAISDWSRPDQFTTPVQAPPIRLAQRKEKPPQRERSPAQSD